MGEEAGQAGRVHLTEGRNWVTSTDCAPRQSSIHATFQQLAWPPLRPWVCCWWRSPLLEGEMKGRGPHSPWGSGQFEQC